MNDKDFSKIISETKGIVLGAIRKNLAPRFYEAVDDVVQEVYLRAYNALEKNQFRGESRISTWLYTIARNESLRMNQKLGREEKKVLKLKEYNKNSKQLFYTETQDRVKEGEVFNDISSEKLHLLVAALPEKYKSVLEMSLNGESEKAIAAKLTLKKGTVKSRKYRAKEILYKIIKEEKYND